jgi:hypothetical protein
MLKQQPTLHITPSNWYQFRVQVDQVKSDYIRSAMDNRPEQYDLHHFDYEADYLELIDSLRAVNKYLSTVAQPLVGVGRGPKPTQRELNPANE